MSHIAVYEDGSPERILLESSKGDRIAEILGSVGVRFERWSANKPLAKDAGQDEVLAAYRDSVDRLIGECGFQTVDVVRMHADHPQKVAFRAKFLREHIHGEDEVRFFVEGQGLFYLHIDGKIYKTLCRQGDLISVPANTRHWFDMGAQPEFTAIRFFNNEEGWVAHFTGSGIADAFPRMAFEVDAILTDIEGVTGSISFVKDILFPYAKQHLAAYIMARETDAAVERILDEARAESGQPDADTARLIATLTSWIDEDKKITPLKELQGLIWEDGYRQGRLTAHVYEDAVDYLRKWRQAGKSLYVYSSGSVKAQKLLFEHTEYGDLRSLFSGYYDTRTGQKIDPASYREITRQIGQASHRILFLSDVVAELDAARAAGMSTALLVRDGQIADAAGHDQFQNFGQIPLS